LVVGFHITHTFHHKSDHRLLGVKQTAQRLRIDAARREQVELDGASAPPPHNPELN
jgi:hypothetical protein